MSSTAPRALPLQVGAARGRPPARATTAAGAALLYACALASLLAACGLALFGRGVQVGAAPGCERVYKSARAQRLDGGTPRRRGLMCLRLRHHPTVLVPPGSPNHPQADVLADLSPEALASLAGERAGHTACLVIRLAFLVSLVAAAPLLMDPFRSGGAQLLAGGAALQLSMPQAAAACACSKQQWK